MHAAWLNREGKDWPHDQPEPHHQSLWHVKETLHKSSQL